MGAGVRIETERLVLRDYEDGRDERPRRRFQLAMTLRGGGEAVGSCGIRRKPDRAREADIGYEVAPRLWGQGYVTEAARAMVDFGFRDLRLHRLSSWCIADNAASARVLEKVGFTLEGRLRPNERFKGPRWDTLLYGLHQGGVGALTAHSPHPSPHPLPVL